MKHKSFKSIIPLLLIGPMVLSTATAFAVPQRQLVIRSIEQEGETHLKIRASAFEADENGTFPISTLDRHAFQIKFGGEQVIANSAGLTMFDSSRRWNNRAVVWAYDATGVRTMKGLNKELRTLTAQEFPNINADFMSILGITSQKTIERVRLDPGQQDNTLALQRRLLGEPGSNGNLVKVYPDSPICVAAKTFEQWTAAGLKNSDQKLLLLMGGASAETSVSGRSSEGCLKQLTNMNVVVHQIIFAKPETFSQRHWITQTDVLSQGAIFRVINLQGALRALQASKNLLDKEYLLRTELPTGVRADADQTPVTLQLLASYHGKTFSSLTAPFVLGLGEKRHPLQPATKNADLRVSPQKLNTVNSKFTLVVNAWLEWIATAFLVGGIVTFRHMRRMGAGALNSTEQEHEDSSDSAPLLLVLNGKDKGQEFRLKQNTVVFGHGFGCDLRLRGQRVQRKHGCLKFQGDKALLEDFSNGDLAVNGRPIHKLRIIGHGSVIQIGELQLLFRCGDT